MTCDQDRRSEARQIIDRVLDGLHNDDDAARLNEILRSDTAVSRYCMSYVELHGHLAWRSGPTTLDADALTAEPALKAGAGTTIAPGAIINDRLPADATAEKRIRPLSVIPHSSFLIPSYPPTPWRRYFWRLVC